MATRINCCRACSGVIYPWLSLGTIYPSAFVDPYESYSRFNAVPLDLVKCARCGLVQLEYSVSPEDMYRMYWYESGLNKSMVAALENVVSSAEKRVELNPGDSVLDIGCNDGTMLSFYPTSINRIGIDPAKNLAEKASSNCSRFINDYFPAKSVDPVKCKVVTTIAMFYDLECPEAFTSAVRAWLHEDGIWIIQMTDLKSMMELTAFDNIVHEHLEYWSLSSLRTFLGNNGIDIFDCEYNNVNGGSLRAYCCHKNKRPISENVESCILSESDVICNSGLARFRSQIYQCIHKVSAVVRLVGASGKMCALGASTKGNTLLQVCGLNGNDIASIGEVNQAKFGKKTIGSEIPIVSESAVLNDNAVRHLLILPWHFSETMRDKCSGFLDRGGILVFPLPKTRMCYIPRKSNNVHVLVL